MMETLRILGLALAALYGIGVVVTLIELWRAPHGFEDDKGFHVVEPEEDFRAEEHHHHHPSPHGTLSA